MINDFLKRADEVQELHRRFPGARIILDGLGHYAPVLTQEAWMQHYGVSSPCEAGEFDPKTGKYREAYGAAWHQGVFRPAEDDT